MRKLKPIQREVKMVHLNSPKLFLGKYPLSKEPCKGLNKGILWTRRDICIPDDFEQLKWAYIDFPLRRSEQRFSEIKRASKLLNYPLFPDNNILRGWVVPFY